MVYSISNCLSVISAFGINLMNSWNDGKYYAQSYNIYIYQYENASNILGGNCGKDPQKSENQEVLLYGGDSKNKIFFQAKIWRLGFSFPLDFLNNF